MTNAYHASFHCDVVETDGAYSIELVVAGLPNEVEAQAVGMWLRNTVMKHLGEIGVLDNGKRTENQH